MTVHLIPDTGRNLVIRPQRIKGAKDTLQWGVSEAQSLMVQHKTITEVEVVLVDSTNTAIAHEIVRRDNR